MVKPSLKVPNVVNADLSGLVNNAGTFFFNTDDNLFSGMDNSFSVKPLPFYDGSGASGTWGINISGTAAMVTTNANLTGDVISVGNATTLRTVNSNVGTFGDGTHVAQFTVNGKGLITSVSNITITGAAPIGAASGDLSATYPNPTVAKINGVTLGSTTASSGNLLIGSGTQWVSTATSGNVTINSSGLMTIGALQIVNSMIAASTIDLTAKVTGILPNSNTTANSANTASAIVTRDGSGNFSAGTITATLSGTATNSTNSAITDDTSTNSYFDVTWVPSNSGDQPMHVSSNALRYNPAVNELGVGPFDFPPDLSTCLNLYALSPQARIIMSGTDYRGLLTDHNGIAITMGLNGPGNKEFWFLDTSYSSIGPTEQVLRFSIINPSALVVVDSISTDGSAQLPILFGGHSAQTSIYGDPITISTTNAVSNQILTLDSSLNLVGLAWTEVTGTSQTMIPMAGYVANNTGLVTLTLPASAAFGTVIYVDGKGAGGWSIAQNASQKIYYQSASTTTGIDGHLDSTNARSCVTLRCITDDTEWVVENTTGEINLV